IPRAYCGTFPALVLLPLSPSSDWYAASVRSRQFLAEAIPPLLEVLDRNPAERLFPTHLHTHGILRRVARGIAGAHADNLANAPISTADKRIGQRLGFLEGHYTSSAAAGIRRAARDQLNTQLCHCRHRHAAPLVDCLQDRLRDRHHL